MDHDEDIRLMLAFQLGNEAAFDTIYRRHAPALARFFWRSTFCWNMSEEMVQETFLKMHRYRKSYEPRAAFRTYLYTVARSVLLNRWKSVLAARSPAPARPDAATDADQPDPEEQAVQRELLSRVEAAMHTLPESQRTALALVRYEGLSYTLLEALGAGVPVLAADIPANRVRERLLRAMVLAPPGDSSAWAQALMSCWGKLPALQAQAVALAPWVLREFSARRQAEALAALYSRVAVPPGSPASG